jgi:hypothetical protein
MLDNLHGGCNPGEAFKDSNRHKDQALCYRDDRHRSACILGKPLGIRMDRLITWQLAPESSIRHKKTFTFAANAKYNGPNLGIKSLFATFEGGEVTKLL